VACLSTCVPACPPAFPTRLQFASGKVVAYKSFEVEEMRPGLMYRHC
jgi:hypothetical protein